MTEPRNLTEAQMYCRPHVWQRISLKLIGCYVVADANGPAGERDITTTIERCVNCGMTRTPPPQEAPTP